MSGFYLTKEVARQLVKRAAELYHQGTGIPIHPLGDEYLPEDTGFIDEIGNAEDLDGAYYWANTLLHFARTVHILVKEGLETLSDSEEEL